MLRQMPSASVQFVQIPQITAASHNEVGQKRYQCTCTTDHETAPEQPKQKATSSWLSE